MKTDYNTVEKKQILSKVTALKAVSKNEIKVKYNSAGIDFVSLDYAKALSEKFGVKR